MRNVVKAESLACTTVRLQRSSQRDVGLHIYRPNNSQFGPVYISEVVEKGPAALNGVIKSGDRIHTVDGHHADELELSDVSEVLQGEPGSIVCLIVSSHLQFAPLSSAKLSALPKRGARTR